MNFKMMLFALLSVLVMLVKVKAAQGDSHCGNGYCFSAIYTASNQMINYTLVVPKGGAQIGWYGVAQGAQMENANMAINWINSDNSLTTSHRSTTAEVMPLTSEVTVTTFSLNPSSQKTQFDQTVWSWNMPMTKDPLNAVQHVFAFCPTSPSSSSVDATIMKHTRHDTNIVLDLTKTYNASAIPNTESSSLSSGSIATQAASSTLTGTNATSAPASATNTATVKSNDSKKTVAKTFLIYLVLAIVAWQLCFQ